MKLYYFEGIDELKEYPDGIIQMRATKVKPFPTCQTCDKWKTKKCIISRLCEDMLRNSNRDISKGIYPDHDFCCINHPDFTGAK